MIPPPLLRGYQDAAIRQLADCLTLRPILVAPTGSGKTVMLSALCRRLKRRVLWVAHRRELIQQAADHLERAGAADYIATSVQKQARRPIPDVGLIVVDEAHHAVPNSQYQKLFDSNIPLIGATATPFRLDGQGLGSLFGALVVAAYPQELADGGFIQSPVIYSQSAPDMTCVKKIGGDYSITETNYLTNKPHLVADVVETWKNKAAGKKTLIFSCTVEHSLSITEAFNRAGIKCEHLDAKTPKIERDKILARLRSGESVASNVMIATEGFDMPDLDCLICARPTASLALWLQMCGRVLRPSGSALILDHAGNALRHGSPMRRINYELHDKQKPEPLGLRMCKQCLVLYPYHLHVCPVCGADVSPVARARAKVLAGELVTFEDKQEVFDYDKDMYKAVFGENPTAVQGRIVDPAKADKRSVFQYYFEKAMKMGYKVGWARVQYKRIFGTWPRGVEGVVADYLNDKFRSGQ